MKRVIDFLYDEARMLDEGRYDEWLALWLEDGHYWMPLDWNQKDPDLVTSLLYEDLFMLKLSGRASEGRAHLQPEAQEPLPSRAEPAVRR